MTPPHGPTRPDSPDVRARLHPPQGRQGLVYAGPACGPVPAYVGPTHFPCYACGHTVPLATDLVPWFVQDVCRDCDAFARQAGVPAPELRRLLQPTALTAP